MAIFIGPLQYQFCQMEDISCSMSSRTMTGWIRPLFDNRRNSDFCNIRNLFSGAAQSPWLQVGQDSSSSKVRVAADYPDSVPNSSSYIGHQGYHPLEEVEEWERSGEKVLTDVEIARTTLEAHSSALLVFPGMVHSEPHRNHSWAEFQYSIDDYGDVFFEIFDDENILQDWEASSPVNVLIGMDFPIYGETERVTSNNTHSLNSSSNDDIAFDYDNKEVKDTEVAGTLIDWGMPDTFRKIHPVYFAKCLTKAVHTKYGHKMDYPSNGLSIVGSLRPAFIDEESHLRRLFHGEDVDGYVSDWTDESEKAANEVNDTYNLIGYGSSIRSTVYKLEIFRIELFSVYGDRSMVSLQDFQEAEPDVLVHSASAIVKHFNVGSMKCKLALKALCRKKKGLNVEVWMSEHSQDWRFKLYVFHSTHGQLQRMLQKRRFGGCCSHGITGKTLKHLVRGKEILILVELKYIYWPSTVQKRVNDLNNLLVSTSWVICKCPILNMQSTKEL
ncbi:uncharacterized protein At3g49140 isoform X2 [Aristolochia californica]|uniref:uncharacterized protein At3g49140 isoform X2 n=1 Tax=Aristolochia californica TaxID=171875 RepID=UPI0035D9B10F